MVRVKEPTPDARHDWRVESQANHLVAPLKWSIETCLERSVTQLADIRHRCRHHELRLESPHQNERLASWWIDNISFAGRFQIECPATYKPSPNMQTRDCYVRSKHFFSPLKTMFGRFACSSR